MCSFCVKTVSIVCSHLGLWETLSPWHFRGLLCICVSKSYSATSCFCPGYKAVFPLFACRYSFQLKKVHFWSIYILDSRNTFLSPSSHTVLEIKCLGFVMTPLLILQKVEIRLGLKTRIHMDLVLFPQVSFQCFFYFCGFKVRSWGYGSFSFTSAFFIAISDEPLLPLSKFIHILWLPLGWLYWLEVPIFKCILNKPMTIWLFFILYKAHM